MSAVGWMAAKIEPILRFTVKYIKALNLLYVGQTCMSCPCYKMPNGLTVWKNSDSLIHIIGGNSRDSVTGNISIQASWTHAQMRIFLLIFEPQITIFSKIL